MCCCTCKAEIWIYRREGHLGSSKGWKFGFENFPSRKFRFKVSFEFGFWIQQTKILQAMLPFIIFVNMLRCFKLSNWVTCIFLLKNELFRTNWGKIFGTESCMIPELSFWDVSLHIYVLWNFICYRNKFRKWWFSPLYTFCL